VYPARFQYFAPTSVDEALDLLARYDDAKVLAGGMSLIPVMKLRIAVPAALVDINRIDGLDTLRRADAPSVVAPGTLGGLGHRSKYLAHTENPTFKIGD